MIAQQNISVWWRGPTAGGLMLLCSAGLCEESPARLSDLNLEQLLDVEIVSVSRRSERSSEAAAAISVLTQDDIRRSGVTSIPDALRLVPGVQVSQIDANKWSVGIRGFQSRLARSLLVLIDGRSVYTPLFAGTYWEVQDLLLEDIERIEVIRGPGGTQWGANAVNGVVNIITKSSRDTLGTLVTGLAGTQDRELGARVGRETEDGAYRVYAKQFFRDGGFRSDNRGFDDWQMGRAGFRMDRPSSPRDQLTLQGDAYTGQTGQRTAITTFSPPANTVAQGDADLSGANLRGRWTRSLDNDRELSVQVYYDHTGRRELNFEENRDTIDLDTQMRMPLAGSHQLTFGAGYRLSSGRFDGVPAVQFDPADRTEQIFSAFVQDEWRFTDRARLSVGTKLEHNAYSGFEWQPSARMAWTPVESQTLWTAVSRAVRTPSRVEEDLRADSLANPGPPLFTRVIGDGQFEPEKLVAYEAGWRMRVNPRLNLDTAVFYNQYRNLLSVEPGTTFAEASPAPPHFVLPIYIRNGLSGNVKGIEIGGDWLVSDAWRLRASHSVLIMGIQPDAGSLDTTTAPGTNGSSPHHQSFLQSTYNFNRRIDLTVQLRHVAQLPAQSIPSYTALDARLGWKLRDGLDLALVGQNLTDSHHPEFAGGTAGLTEVPRSMYLKAILQW